jgi:hypothetical protein
MSRTQAGLGAKFTKNDFFPKLDRGFWADLTSSTEQLRLFAHIDEVRWVASVYNKRTKEWIAESSGAKDSEDAKHKAEEVARRIVPGPYPIEWCSIGACRS